MKKSSLFRITTFVILSLLLITSCTKKPGSIKLIPSNAHVVTVFNIPSLIEKGDLMNAVNLETIKKARNNKQNLKVNEVKLLDRIFEKPLSIGLHYEKDWFSFYVKKSKQLEFFCIAASVIDEKSLTNFIEESLNATEGAYKIEDNENYKFSLVDQNTAFAWDKEKLLIIVEENNSGVESDLKAKLAELFTLESKNQLVENENFQQFYKNKKDISLWLTTNLFEEEKEFQELEKEYDIVASDNYFSFFLEFEEGEINLASQFDGNEKLQDLLINHKILNNDFNTDLLEYFPSDNLSLISLSLNTDMLFEKIKENRMVAMGNFSKVTPQEFLESMDGSIAFSVVEVKKDSQNSIGNDIKPSVVLAFDLNDKAVLEELISILPQGMLDENEGYYEIVAARNLNQNVFLAFNSSTCLLTNDEELIKQFKDGISIPKNLRETSISSEIAGNSLYVNVQLDEDKLSEDIKIAIEENQSNTEKELMNVLKKITESVDFKLTNKNTADCSLKIKNKEENSLKVIIKTLDENFERFEEVNRH